jgi:endonuclease-3
MGDCIREIIAAIEGDISGRELPVSKLICKWKGEPFKILATVMLSSRTKDEVTAQAANRLFSAAPCIKSIQRLSLPKIESLIRPVGFYKTKAKNLKKMVEVINLEFGGRVPDKIEDLVILPGVGRKTANLVVSEAFGKAGICVDTHVHRIANRLGYVSTKTPYETEIVLRKKLPKIYWKTINKTLVLFGQKTCRPISPKCGICPVSGFCKRVGVNSGRK